MSFELVPGYVFTDTDEKMEMLPGTLHLTDCLSQCRLNRTCQSINFETGLCVLFSSSSQQAPQALTASQFPVFTIYAQKICLMGECGSERRQSPALAAVSLFPDSPFTSTVPSLLIMDDDTYIIITIIIIVNICGPRRGTAIRARQTDSALCSVHARVAAAANVALLVFCLFLPFAAFCCPELPSETFQHSNV